ncbi:hypothetical protein F5Y16DRAFT_332315 [Xylariaceae sp. FL0255]|nr:hypothetical protein F5Y16DRAFT_332315 [Xylariaceae sp. FL0255]
MSQLKSRLRALDRKRAHAPRIPQLIPIRPPLSRKAGLSLAHLPQPLIAQILSYVECSSHETMQSLALSSSWLYDIVRYVQHRTVSINLDHCICAREHLDFILRRQLLRVIRVLKIRHRYSMEVEAWSEEQQAVLDLLADMLPGMGGLKDLQWNVKQPSGFPIPRPILDNLRSEVRLHTTVVCGTREQYHLRAQEFLTGLVGNSNLYSLSAELWYYDERHCVGTSQVLKAVLLTCPNLTLVPRISICVPPTGWCGSDRAVGNPQVYCGLGLSGSEKLPPLEEFGVHAYPWATVVNPDHPIQQTEMDYWANTFDWSRLRRLHSVPWGLALKMAPKLTVLEEVRLQTNFGSELAEFLNMIPSRLTHLSFEGWAKDEHRVDRSWMQSITRHGATLRVFRLETPVERWRANTLITDEDLASICDETPYLEEICVARDNNDAHESSLNSTLGIYARLPQLRNLILWFRLGDTYKRDTRYLTASAAVRLFLSLRNQNKKLNRLELRVENPIERAWAFDSSPMWDRDNSLTLVCEISNHDGAPKITCLELSARMNTELRHLLTLIPREPLTIQVCMKKKYPLKLKAALDGPLTTDEWRSWTNSERAKWQKQYKRDNSLRWQAVRSVPGFSNAGVPT